MGTHKRPFYRVVVANDRARREGPFIEIIGTYNPQKGPEETKINLERAKHWLEQGAQPTDIAKKLLHRAGL